MVTDPATVSSRRSVIEPWRKAYVWLDTARILLAAYVQCLLPISSRLQVVCTRPLYEAQSSEIPEAVTGKREVEISSYGPLGTTSA